MQQVLENKEILRPQLSIITQVWKTKTITGNEVRSDFTAKRNLKVFLKGKILNFDTFFDAIISKKVSSKYSMQRSQQGFLARQFVKEFILAKQRIKV